MCYANTYTNEDIEILTCPGSPMRYTNKTTINFTGSKGHVLIRNRITIAIINSSNNKIPENTVIITAALNIIIIITLIPTETTIPISK